MRPFKVAIYSGEIPSTTFIEQLINTLSRSGCIVFLFGNIQSPVNYSDKNIRVWGIKRGNAGHVQAVSRILGLMLSHYSKYIQLKRHLGYGPFSGVAQFKTWSKYAPILSHLPDVFHVQWAKSAPEWLWLKEIFGVKLVLSLRGTQVAQSPVSDPYWEAEYKRTFPKYDAFHSVSLNMIELGMKYGLNPNKAKTIYSGLPAAALPSSAVARQKTLRILAVGRFHWLKGYRYLLDALAILKEKKIDFTFTLIAPGRMPEEILYQIHDLGLQEQLIWLHGLPHEQVLQAMRENDVLVLSSLSEGIPNVVLEAMNVGLPVITTECGGVGEVIQSASNGFVVPVRDPLALANSILNFSALGQRQLEEITMNANRTIRERFDAGKNMKGFIDLYESILN